VILARLAAVLRALADQLDPPAVPAVPALAVPAAQLEPVAAVESQTQRARRLVADQILRETLHRALRRYSPPEERGQA
jgi:hypothetical protein